MEKEIWIEIKEFGEGINSSIQFYLNKNKINFLYIKI